MTIGLNKEELIEPGCFGKTPEESNDTLFGKPNERITKQLTDAGIKLPD